MGTRRKDEIYINGVLVGWTDVCEDVPVGNYCQGYFEDGCGRIAFDLDSPTSQGVDVTSLNDGTMILSLDGGPTTKQQWINLLEDTLIYLKN